MIIKIYQILTETNNIRPVTIALNNRTAFVTDGTVTWKALNDEFRGVYEQDITLNNVIDWDKSSIFKVDFGDGTETIDIEFDNIEIGKTITILIKGSTPFTFVNFLNQNIFDTYDPNNWNALQVKCVGTDDNSEYRFITSLNYLN